MAIKESMVEVCILYADCTLARTERLHNSVSG